jgi:PAS domain S-box-containing protein
MLISRSVKQEALSMQQFKQVWDYSLDGMRITDLKGIIIDVNNAFCKFVDLEKEELIGFAISKYHLPEYQDHVMERFYNFINSGKIEERIERVLTLWNKKVYNVELSNSHIKLIDGRDCVLSIFHDITEMKTAEKEKLESFEMLKKITDTTPEIITLYDIKTEGNIFQNRSLLRTLGYSSEQVDELTKKDKGKDLVHREDESLDEINFKKTETLLDNEVHLFEYRIKDSDGNWNWIRRRTSVYSRGEDGKPDKLVNVYTNITDEKEANEKLKQSEERYRTLVETSPYPVMLCDLQGNIIFCNNAMAFKFGYNRAEEIIGINTFHLLQPSYIPHVTSEFQKLASGEKETIQLLDVAVQKKDSTILFADYHATLLKDSYGKPYGIISILNDITEKKAAIQTLKEREKYLNAIFNAMPDAIFILDYEGYYKDFHISKDFEAIIPPEHIIGSNIKDVLPVDEANKILELIQSSLKKHIVNRHTYQITINNQTKYYEATIAPFTTNEILSIQRDVTDKKKSEEEIVKRENYLQTLVEIDKSLLQASTKNEVFSTVLRPLGEVSGASRVYIFENSIDENGSLLMSQKAEWTADGIKPFINDPVSQNLPYKSFSDRFEQILLNEDVYTGIVKTFPEKESKILQEQDILSILVLPLYVNNDFFGFIGFDNCKEEREWTASEISLLKAASGSISLSLERIIWQENLKESEEKFRMLAETAPAGIFIFKDSKFLYVNNYYLNLFGYEFEELNKMNFYDMAHPDYREMFKTRAMNRLKGIKEPNRYEVKALTKNGNEIWIDLTADIIQYEGEKATLGMVYDITDRKLLEENIKISEKYYRELFESAHDSIIIFDPVSERVYDVNERACKIYGFTRKEFLNISLLDISTNVQLGKDMINQVMEKNSIENLQTVHINKNGDRMLMEINATVIDYKGLKAILSIGRDITSKKHAEDQILASLKEKEVLLKEVHHRVKNNLQVISSLLKLQTEYIKDESDLELFKESQNRIKSMALIHEKLYRSHNLAKIDFAEYIRSLSDNLFFTYSVKSSRVKMTIDSLKTEFNIETAIPLGLIINELLTNCLKHAFSANDSGEILIKLTKQDNNKFKLLVIDDGIGIPANLNINDVKTLGLQLVLTLCTQLNAEINVYPLHNGAKTAGMVSSIGLSKTDPAALSGRKGTCFDIVFDEIKYKER